MLLVDLETVALKQSVLSNRSVVCLSFIVARCKPLKSGNTAVRDRSHEWLVFVVWKGCREVRSMKILWFYWVSATVYVHPGWSWCAAFLGIALMTSCCGNQRWISMSEWEKFNRWLFIYRLPWGVTTCLLLRLFSFYKVGNRNVCSVCM